MGPPGKDVLEGRAAAIKSELLKAGIQGNACIRATRVAVELFRRIGIREDPRRRRRNTAVRLLTKSLPDSSTRVGIVLRVYTD